MDPPSTKLEYRSGAEEPRPKGVFRQLLAALGWLWFGFFLFVAVMGFVMRGLGDEPGSPMTVPRALVMSLFFVVVGLPGLAVVLAANRLGR